MEESFASATANGGWLLKFYGISIHINIYLNKIMQHLGALIAKNWHRRGKHSRNTLMKAERCTWPRWTARSQRVMLSVLYLLTGRCLRVTSSQKLSDGHVHQWPHQDHIPSEQTPASLTTAHSQKGTRSVAEFIKFVEKVSEPAIQHVPSKDAYEKLAAASSEVKFFVHVSCIICERSMSKGCGRKLSI